MTTIQPLRGEGVFEITDYTTASDWERFIAQLEDILTEWKLTKQSDVLDSYKELPVGFISTGMWHEKRDSIKFGNTTFDVRFQYIDDDHVVDLRASSSVKEDNFQDAISQDEISGETLIEKERQHGEHELPDELPECLRDIVATTNDFASKAHCLVRWYNLRKFLMIIPRSDTIVSEDRIKLLLSSASIALSNIDCHVPAFVQTRNITNNIYQGISENMNIRTMFEMVHFSRSLKQYSYLSELISLFREKSSCNLNDPISVAIRLNYCLDSFELFLDPRERFEGYEFRDEDDSDKVGHNDDDAENGLVKLTESKRKLSKLRAQDMRSGASFENVKQALPECLPHPFKIMKFIHVAALWPPISDKVVTDSQVHSDLDPAEAPLWTIRCVTSDNCNMKIVHETQAINDLLLAAVKYAYDKLDGDRVFGETPENRRKLEDECLELSYKLATQPEVILSRSPTDHIRKIVALIFYRAAELRMDDADALDQIAGQLRKRPSLSELYRDFKRTNKPSVKEFILRTQISRPFNPITSPALPQRMFCTICDNEFRLCGAFSELCN